MKSTVYPASSARFDWWMAVLASLVAAGMFQDGWAHNHGLVDQSFFTPWHAVLYGTMALNGLVLLACGLRNLRRGYRFGSGLPYGYWLSAMGVVLFLAAGGLDLAWHTLFGIEEDINALISPTHLLLALAGVFVLSGPLRSVAYRVAPDAPARWRDTGPAILTAASMLSVMAFFTMYANPIGSEHAASVMGKSDRAPVVAQLYAMRADGTHQTRLQNSAADEFGVTVSPDGKRIAYRAAVGDGKAEIFTANLDGSAQRQITYAGRWATQPAWSPDGTRIAFVSAPAGTSGNFQLATIEANGTKARTLVDGVAQIDGPAWTPDGSKIAYGTRSGLTTQIAVVAASGGTPSFIAGTLGGSFPAFSRDGKLLAFTVPKSGHSDIFIALPDGSKAHKTITGGSMPAFSRRGDRLAFVFTHNGVTDVGLAGVYRNSSADLSEFSGMSASRPAWTPDGRILYTAIANPNMLDTNVAQAFAVDTFLVSSVLLMGAILVLLRRFNLPFGTLTVLVLIYAAEQATQQDHYFAVTPAFIVAAAGDVVLALGGKRLRTGAAFYAFAFAFSFAMAALFIAVVYAKSGGLGWPADLTFGTPVLAGFAGLLVAFCCAIPLQAPAQVPTPSL